MTLKVYGIGEMNDKGKYQRAVVAVKNQAEAAKALGYSKYYLANYGSITGNKKEVAAALRYPGRKVVMLGKD